MTGRLEGDIEGIAETRPDGSLDYRVESTISNEDGVWDSPWSTDPMVRGPRPDFEHFQYWKSTGSGAYAGLTYHGFWYFPERKSFRPGDTFVWSGWIEEAK